MQAVGLDPPSVLELNSSTPNAMVASGCPHPGNVRRTAHGTVQAVQLKMTPLVQIGTGGH